MSMIGIKKGVAKVTHGGRSATAANTIPIPNDVRVRLDYANKNFIEPFDTKKYPIIEENYFNFQYINDILNQLLEKYSRDGILTNLLKLYIETMGIIQRSMDTRLSLSNCYTTSITNRSSNTVLFETDRLIFNNTYFVYHILFGEPTHTLDYDKDNLNIIKAVLTSNPGITMSVIRRHADIVAITS